MKKSQGACAGWPGHFVQGKAGVGRVMVVDRAEGGSAKCEGGAREGLCGQRERAESMNGAHTFIIYTHRGWVFFFEAGASMHELVAPLDMVCFI